ncbi:MAG: NAD(P)/FAD-dependent oxidoreductase, partial [Chloroflexota bacterium]
DDSLVRLEDDRLLTMREARATHPDFDVTRSWDIPDVAPHPGDEDLYHYLARIGFTPEQLQYTRRSFVNATGEGIHHISATAALTDMHGDDYGHEDWRVMDGYDRIIAHLAAGLDIRTGQVVAAIRWHGETITVETLAGNSYDAEQVVIALPLGVLKAGRITFDPPLPPERVNALGGLAMGPGMKIVYVFDEPILPEGIGALYSKHNPPMWWSPTFGQEDAPQFAITAFATGDWARQLLKFGTEIIGELGLSTLRKELGKQVPAPVHIHIENWTHDPFAGGVYSVVTPGSVHCRAEAATPLDNRLFWAGEAVAPNGHAATVHGAYLTGARAANEVLASR